MNTTIKQILRIAGNDPQKAEELQVATRFLQYYNATHRTDFVLSEIQPIVDNPVDVLAQSESNSSKKLKIQVTTSDAEVRRTFSTNGEVLRITNPGEENPVVVKGIIEPVCRKSGKYTSLVKGDLILLLDYWWSIRKLTDDQIISLKIRYRNFFVIAGFREIWLVDVKKSYQIYP